MSAVVKRSDIDRLQASILSEFKQVELPTSHYFVDGMYARELPRPATATIVGKVHKKDHLYIVMAGKVTIVMGEETITVEGPKVFVCKAGTKRAVYAHTDAVCLTVHRTEFTDLADVENDLIEPDETSPFLPGNTLKQELLA